MVLANDNDIKFKNNRAYRYSRNQCRFFPISMSKALNMIANGEARFYEPVQ